MSVSFICYIENYCYPVQTYRSFQYHVQTCIPEMTTKFHNRSFNVCVALMSIHVQGVGKEKGDGESIFQSGETDAVPIDLLLNHFSTLPNFVLMCSLLMCNI